MTCCNCCKESKPERELQRCGGCQEQVYCSKACQKAQWKLGHREECKLMQAQRAMKFKESPQLERFETLFRKWYSNVFEPLLRSMAFAAIYSNPDPNCTCDSHYVFIRLKMEDNIYLTIADWGIEAFDELRNTDPENYLGCTNFILENAGRTKCLTLLVYIHPDEEYGSVVENRLHRMVVSPVPVPDMTVSHTELKEKGREYDASGLVRFINSSEAEKGETRQTKKEKPDAYKASKIVDKWLDGNQDLLRQLFYSALFHQGNPFDRGDWVLRVAVSVDVRGDGRPRVLRHAVVPLDYFRTALPPAAAAVEQARAAMPVPAGGTSHAILFECKNNDAGMLFSFWRCLAFAHTRAKVAQFGRLQTPQKYQKKLNKSGKKQR